MGFEFDSAITRERLHQMSVEELNQLAEMLEKEVKEKRSGRRRELIEAVCKSVNVLMEEFPMTELYIDHQCDECGDTEEIEVLEWFFAHGDKLKPCDFS